MSGPSGSDPMLSCAMIVRNESVHLSACMERLAPLGLEWCIVDTGSDDDTRSIAEARGARVADFPWRDDFAAARNASLALCTAPWILVIDADERLDDAGIAELLTVATAAPDRAFRYLTRNYTRDESITGFTPSKPGDPWAIPQTGAEKGELRPYPGWHPSHKVRLVPNVPGIAFEGAVHELIEPSLRRLGIPVADATATIHHYPLEHNAERLATKQAMYLRLGLRKVDLEPENAQAWFELGDQCAESEDYPAAIEAYSQGLKRDSQHARVWKDLGGVLYLVGRLDEALRAIKLALQLDSMLGEAWRNLGVVYAAMERFGDAVDAFDQALAVQPQWREGHRYRSVALERAGRVQEAVDAARKAVESAPESAAARDQLARLLSG